MVETVNLLRDIYPKYQIGVGTYGDLKVLDWGCALSIGNYCSFGFDVTILLGGGHRTEWVTTYPFSTIWEAAAHIPGHPVDAGPVKIGNDVWAGSGSTIFSGVEVGDGAVIGAKSVVTDNVPPYAIVAGSPAKILRYRFEPDVIERLLKISWWDWDEARIKKAIPLLLNKQIMQFIIAVESGLI